MAKVLNPLMSNDAKGSVQGLTFSINKGIHTARRKSEPVRRFRSTQPANRASWGFISTAWQGLTALVRAQWAAWAASHPQPDGFGGTFLMSGFNAFMMLGQRRISGGLSAGAPASPPTTILVAWPATMVLADGALSGSIKADFTCSGVPAAGDKIQIFLSAPNVGGGRYDGLKGWTKFASVAGTAVTYSATTLQAGMWYGVRIRYVQADGQASSYLQGIWMAKA